MSGEIINWRVTIVDSLDPFYDLRIKHRNLEMCRAYGNQFNFLQLDVTNHEVLTRSLTENYEVIVHLAAKTGVRPSVTNPRQYSFVNTQGTQNMLEIARERIRVCRGAKMTKTCVRLALMPVPNLPPNYWVILIANYMVLSFLLYVFSLFMVHVNVLI